MIEMLILRDFKSHRNTRIEFHSGLNVFLGEVGAGKTSILEGVSFALFGRCAGNVTQSGLIRRGADHAKISLVFSTRLGRYKVDRTIYSEKTQRVYFWIFEENDWSLAIEGATSVSRSIEDLLDMDSSIFLAAIYASQGEIKELLETQPGRRREQLDKLLGIDIYEKIWQKLGEARNIVLNGLTQAQEKADGFIVLKNQIKDLTERSVKNKTELEILEALSDEIQDRLQPEEEQLTTFEGLRHRLLEVKTRTEGKNSEIKNALAMIKSLKEKIEKASKAEIIFRKNMEYIQLEKVLESEKRRIKNAIQQKENLKELVKRDEADLQEAENRRKNLENQLENLTLLEKMVETLDEQRKDMLELEKNQVELQKKLVETKTEAAKSLNEIENQKGKVERVSKLGECPTCFQVVPEEHKEKIKRDAENRVTRLEDEFKISEESIQKIQGQVNEIKSQIEIVSKADRKYVEVSIQVRMLKSRREEVEEVESKIQKIQYRLNEMKEKISEIRENAETLNEVTVKIVDAVSKASMAREAEKKMITKGEFENILHEEEENMEILKLQLEMLRTTEKQLIEEYNVEEHRKVEESVKFLRRDIAKNREGIERLRKLIEEDDSRIDQSENQLKEKIKAWKQVENLKTENAILEDLRGSLREVVQPVTRKNNVLEVSESFQTFYQELSNDNIDYASLDEEGSIKIIRNGEPSPVTSLSGGETTCAALALRLSICRSLTKDQLLLLDEPTIHLDELYRGKLRELLSNYNFRQLIVVTHDNTFDSLPAQIFRVEKKMGESVISPLTT